MSAARDHYFAMATNATSQKDTTVTESDRQLLIETRDLCRTIRDQLCGPGSGYPGWPQTGGRTLTDTVAAIAEKQGVPNAKDTMKW